MISAYVLLPYNPLNLLSTCIVAQTEECKVTDVNVEHAYVKIVNDNYV
jgi:hypothetical protein